MSRLLGATAMVLALGAPPAATALAASGEDVLSRVHLGGDVQTPPARFGLKPFYRKYLDAGGIPVVSSERVQDRALAAAAALAERMLEPVPAVRARMIAGRVRIGVIGAGEQTTDLPEYRDFYKLFPGTDWNARARGFGAVPGRPVCSVGEENLLGLPTDRYRGESIFIHEFAHSMADVGIIPGNPSFKADLEAAYRHAKAKGLWLNTYAATNPQEYWAEGVQSWFDANLTASPANGIHNEVGTRELLKAYDPVLSALIARVFPDGKWRYRYPGV